MNLGTLAAIFSALSCALSAPVGDDGTNIMDSIMKTHLQNWLNEQLPLAVQGQAQA